MSCKYSRTDKTLEGSLTDITSQYLKEKSIAKEIERLKTEALINEESKNNTAIKNEETNSQLIHDLKSPLNSIFGFLTLIENQHYETIEELVEFSQNAKIAGENLLQTIDKKFGIEVVRNEKIEINDEALLEENTLVEDQSTITDSIIDFRLNDFNVKSDSGPNLLLVEDNPMNQQVEIKLLKKAGYNVFAIETGEEAIEQVKTNKFDLVLMDIDLPGMNGLEATKEIRNLAQHLSNIPVIAATAKSSMKDREKCLDAGMNDYISKPINISFMKMTIDQWLKQKVL
jgi:CheY-like chemotaxis protein